MWRRKSLRSLAFLSIFCLPSLLAAEAPYHHVHLTATDAPEAAAWYAKHMEGEVVGDGRVAFDDVLVLFFVKDAGFSGSDGSSVDHIGFSFEDLQAKMMSFEEAGIKVLAPVRDVRGLFKFAFIEDPWGTKIEVMQDPDQTGFHHVHLKGPDPEKIFDWYEMAFGGTRARYKDLLDALLYDDVWLLVQDSGEEAMAATRGRSIDHLGWSFADLDAAATELKAKGVQFRIEPMPYRDVRIAFIEGPGGVSIELVQPASE